ncbi:MAG: Kanadaptin [Paramarteilia canceri]
MDMIEENKISDDNQSDSDEDEYLDRSGAAASKRSQRILKRGSDSKTNDSIITFESILSDLKETISKIETIKSQLKHEQKISNKNNEETQLDSLEAYMNAIKQGSMTIKEKQSLKYQLNELEIIKTKTIKYLHQLKPFTMDEDEFKKILDNAEKISHSEKFCSSSPTSGDRLREENISFESLKPVEVQAFCEQNEEEDSSAKLTKNEEVLAKKVKLHSETVKNISELPVHNDSTEEFQEKISTWEPPTDQTGDGETYLNKKFGY